MKKAELRELIREEVLHEGLKWKSSKNNKVEGFVSKSFPHPTIGDGAISAENLIKKWTPRLEKWLSIKIKKIPTKTNFFPDWGMDFEFFDINKNKYRIYSSNENSKSATYIVQKYNRK